MESERIQSGHMAQFAKRQAILIIRQHFFDLPTTRKESCTKHLPFSLLVKNLKKQSFEAQSSNHSGIF
jgi:hypothetical protein